MIRRSILITAVTLIVGIAPVTAARNTVRDPKGEAAASPAGASRQMRDARKKLVVERVQERLNNVNERRTEHFLNVLERLSTILDKIESRTEKAKTEGKEVAAIESAITSARTAILTAQSAVGAQKAKTYEITVTDDRTAKGEVEATVKQLHADLKSVYDTVVAARQAVHNVFGQIKTVVDSTE